MSLIKYTYISFEREWIILKRERNCIRARFYFLHAFWRCTGESLGNVEIALRVRVGRSTIESSSHTGAPPGRYFGRDEPLWRGGKTGLGTGSVARRYSGRPTRTIVCIRTGRFVDVSICGFASFVSASGGRSSVLFDAIGKSRMVKKPIFFTPL